MEKRLDCVLLRSHCEETSVIHVGVVHGWAVCTSSNGAIELVRLVVAVYHPITAGADGEARAVALARELIERIAQSECCGRGNFHKPNRLQSTKRDI